MKPTAEGTGDFYEMDYTEEDMRRFTEISSESDIMNLARKVLDKRRALLTQPIFISTPKLNNRDQFNKILKEYNKK